jgi:hypothetical protein
MPAHVLRRFAAGTPRVTTFMPESGHVALSDGSPDRLDSLTAWLDAPAEGFGLWLRSTLATVNLDIALLDAGGNVLDSFTQTFDDQWTFLSFTADTPFSGVRLRATGNGGAYVAHFIVDDVRYGTPRPAQVPEPGSLALPDHALTVLAPIRAPESMTRPSCSGGRHALA